MASCCSPNICIVLQVNSSSSWLWCRFSLVFTSSSLFSGRRHGRGRTVCVFGGTWTGGYTHTSCRRRRPRG